MPNLSAPTPSVEYKPPPPAPAALEKPLEIRCAKVTFPDGSEFVQASGTAGFFAYREPSAGVLEIWNEDAKRWEPDPGAQVGALKPKPLIFKEGDAAPWQSPLVASGQKDKDGKDQFAKAAPDFPRYSFRSFFSGARDGQAFTGLSAPSAPVRFASALDSMRAGLSLGEDETTENATELTIALKDAALRVVGSIFIKAEGGSARVEISNAQSGAQRAVVRLLANGDIELQPAAGRNLVMRGPVQAGSIFYQPADPFTGSAVGEKKWLQT
jgi:hypothetical protein